MNILFINDFNWKKDITVKDLVTQFAHVGYQSIELAKAANVIVKMKHNSAKTYMTFTSNMVTSGLRGFFAQLIKLGIPNVIVTTAGGLEEDLLQDDDPLPADLHRALGLALLWAAVEVVEPVLVLGLVGALILGVQEAVVVAVGIGTAVGVLEAVHVLGAVGARVVHV